MIKFISVFLLVLVCSSADKLEDIQLKEARGITKQMPNRQPVNYPVRLAYIDRLAQWWPPEKIAAGMGVPGYADNTIYNYIALAFWSCAGNPMDIAMVWANAATYFQTDSPFGRTTGDIQRNLRKRYNDNGMKILVSAFGATQFPTSSGLDPNMCGAKLGQFVLDNNLDGADIDWEDNQAMEAGRGEQWLIDFTRKLREVLPNHVITHAPQGPYFKKQYYKNGAYVTVHQQVGSLIDFYNVQFYNQGDTKYDNYDELFIRATGFFSGTSVKEIIARGIPANKIVIGKPVTPGDAANTGYMQAGNLGNAVSKAYSDFHWYGGIMYWQYISDNGGQAISTSAGHLKEMCSIDKNCK